MTVLDNESQAQENRDNSLLTDITTLKTVVDLVETLIEELTDDHATNIAAIADNQTQIDAVIVDLAALATVYDTTLAKLDADAGITDTNYAATNPAGAATGVSTTAAPAATLTAPKPSSVGTLGTTAGT